MSLLHLKFLQNRCPCSPVQPHLISLSLQILVTGHRCPWRDTLYLHSKTLHVLLPLPESTPTPPLCLSGTPLLILQDEVQESTPSFSTSYSQLSWSWSALPLLLTLISLDCTFFFLSLSLFSFRDFFNMDHFLSLYWICYNIVSCFMLCFFFLAVRHVGS